MIGDLPFVLAIANNAVAIAGNAVVIIKTPQMCSGKNSILTGVSQKSQRNSANHRPLFPLSLGLCHIEWRDSVRVTKNIQKYWVLWLEMDCKVCSTATTSLQVILFLQYNFQMEWHVAYT